MPFTNIQQLYSAFLSSTGVSTDTRKLTEENIFIALKGPRFNGNTHAENALANGAKFAVVDEPAFVQDDRYLLVADGLKALQDLATYHRSQLKIPFIGVAGSNGKTTTKELITKVLSARFNTFATQGNLNNHIGVPLTILSITQSHEMAVIELGANHLGEIADLCRIAQPTHGLITNVGMDHLEGYGTLENVAKGNAELYDYLKETNGVVFVNSTDSTLVTLAAQVANNIPYMQKGDYYWIQLVNGDFYLKLQTLTGKSISTQLIGTYNIPNITIALAIGKYFGLEEEKSIQAIESYIPSNNRSQLIKKDTNTLILDAYNANPSSVKAAIENFASMKLENKIVALGDMLELGAFSASEHKAIGKLLASLSFKKVILCGLEFQAAKSEILSAEFFLTTTEASEWIKSQHFTQSSFLIKGSRGMGMEKIADNL
jgi:UDP-N-acetylmuramoyl-tripeptide--D-alanyl-D-alanine ligase